MENLLFALKDAGVVDKRDVYLSCIIEANYDVFREVVNMSLELKKRLIMTGNEDGWFDERDLERDLECARRILSSGESPERVSMWMNIPLERVEALL